MRCARRQAAAVDGGCAGSFGLQAVREAAARKRGESNRSKAGSCGSCGSCGSRAGCSGPRSCAGWSGWSGCSSSAARTCTTMRNSGARIEHPVRGSDAGGGETVHAGSEPGSGGSSASCRETMAQAQMDPRGQPCRWMIAQFLLRLAQ
jgi:hypothetical protein